MNVKETHTVGCFICGTTKKKPYAMWVFTPNSNFAEQHKIPDNKLKIIMNPLCKKCFNLNDKTKHILIERKSAKIMMEQS